MTGQAATTGGLTFRGCVAFATITLLAILIFSTLGAFAQCEQVMVVPWTHTDWVDSSKPDQSNFDTGDFHVMDSARKIRRSYYNFDLSAGGAYPLPSGVISVHFTIDTEDKNEPGTVGVFATSWAGTPITWNTAPAFGALIASQDNTPPPGGGTVGFDVTSAVLSPGSVSFAVKYIPEYANDNPKQHCDHENPRLVIVYNACADLEVEKTDSADPTLAGEPLTYTIIATNNGPNDATGVEVTETLPASVSFLSATPSQGGYNSGTGIWSVGDLANGAVATLVLVVNVSVDAPSQITNTVCIDGDQTDSDSLNNCDDETTTVDHTPVLLVEKSGLPTAASVGDMVSYTITVQHDPSSDGSPIDIDSVSDSLGIVLSGPTGDDDGDGLLEDGEVWTYIGSREILPTDPTSLINEVCVEGTDVDGDPVASCGSTTTTVDHDPVLLVLKSSDMATATVGDIVSYTVTVQHDASSDNSPVVMTTVTDSLGIVLSGPTGDDGDGLLEDGEVWTYIGSREILPTDPTSLINEACVEGIDLDGDLVGDCGSTTTTVDHHPALLVEKLSDSSNAVVGDIVTYTITVQHDNSSDGSAIAISDVSDTLIFSLVGPSGDIGNDGLLEAGEIWTYMGSREVLPTDPTELTNIACANGFDLDGEALSDCDSTTTIVEHAPVLEVLKSGLPTTAAVGDTIDYTIAVQHAPSSDGSPIDITDVVDSLGIALAGPAGDDGNGLLEEGEVWIYTGSREILPSDPQNLINEVCVEGEDLDGDLVEDCGSTTTIVEHAPVLLVEKAGVPLIANVGNTIAYMITVQHDPASDNSPVDITSVNDSLGIVLSGPSGDDGDGLLEAGEIWTYIGSREVLPTDPENLVNEVCVEGQDLDGDTVSDCGDTTTTVRHSPVLIVEKTGDPAAVAVGDTVTYTITVQHDVSSDGSPIDVTSVIDSLGVVLSGPSGDSNVNSLLDANEVWTYIGLRVAQVSDPHELTNTVCVDGVDLDGDPVEDCDSTITLVSHPDIEVTKTADVAFAGIGDTITYTYLVGNTGDVDLYSISLIDDVLGTISGPASGDNGNDVLEIHEIWTYESTHLVIEADSS